MAPAKPNCGFVGKRNDNGVSELLPQFLWQNEQREVCRDEGRALIARPAGQCSRASL